MHHLQPTFSCPLTHAPRAFRGSAVTYPPSSATAMPPHGTPSKPPLIHLFHVAATSARVWSLPRLSYPLPVPHLLISFTSPPSHLVYSAIFSSWLAYSANFSSRLLCHLLISFTLPTSHLVYSAIFSSPRTAAARVAPSSKPRPTQVAPPGPDSPPSLAQLPMALLSPWPLCYCFSRLPSSHLFYSANFSSHLPNQLLTCCCFPLLRCPTRRVPGFLSSGGRSGLTRTTMITHTTMLPQGATPTTFHVKQRTG